MTRRFQFSLRGFFVSLAMLSLFGSNVFVALKWNQERKENERLREDLGYLTIDDPTQFYVREVPTYEPLSWRWRIYAPPGNRVFKIGSGFIPKKDLKAGATAGRGTAFPTDPLTGEYTLTARIERDQIGIWELVVSYPEGGMKHTILDPSWLPKNPQRHHLTTRNFQVDVAGGKPVMGSARKRQSESFSPDEPLVLLRLRAPEDLAADTGAPCEGVMIWFDNHLRQERVQAPRRRNSP